MFQVRDDEPEYAKLKDSTFQEKNRYGKPIVLTEDGGVSLRINGDEGIGPNPNRTKQHAFHFTADNCIGCHACEAACSEKNDLPPHLSFRSVGYVEGGTYPNYARVNISMACNHCDDPVCLKGCPTRAYTKHPEFGAVIQDPDICFGCGYCTWVCPYNAPQLDPVKGEVEKCNMCVDRLEVGLKPACVAACVGNALDFGVVENMPAGRDQIETQIPGFPDPSITRPNIRFQQVKTLPREVTRTDSMPVKYHKNPVTGVYKPAVDQKADKTAMWNIKRLSSRENPLVLFTLMTQAAIGTFMIAFLGALLGSETLTTVMHSALYVPMLLVALGLVGLGLFMSTTHLGKPWRFYRGFNNLRHSPVSREGLGIVLFQAGIGLHLLFMLPANGYLQSLMPDLFTPGLASALRIPAVAGGLFAALAACGGLYYMYRCYRIKARPFWNHWHAGAAFLGTVLSLGSLVIALINVPAMVVNNGDYAGLLGILSITLLSGMALEGVGLFFHARDMRKNEHEGAASHYVQTTTFGKTYYLRNAMLVANMLAVLALALGGFAGPWGLLAWGVVTVSILTIALIGRGLFYVLVIPTTMPGAFFWKNKAFEQHARDIGLARLPQVGVPLKDH